MESIKCANCMKEIYLGNDAKKVEEGVIGFKDFVPLLDQTIMLCSDRCAAEYFDLSDLPEVKRRIP